MASLNSTVTFEQRLEGKNTENHLLHKVNKNKVQQERTSNYIYKDDCVTKEVDPETEFWAVYNIVTRLGMLVVLYSLLLRSLYMASPKVRPIIEAPMCFKITQNSRIHYP